MNAAQYLCALDAAQALDLEKQMSLSDAAVFGRDVNQESGKKLSEHWNAMKRVRGQLLGESVTEVQSVKSSIRATRARMGMKAEPDRTKIKPRPPVEERLILIREKLKSQTPVQ